MNILFLSSWYPTDKNPNFGVFVKEHAHAIQSTGNNIVVLAVVIHRSSKLWSVSISDFVDKEGVRTVLIEVNARFRDLVYHAIPLQYCIVQSVFRKHILPGFKPDFIHSNVIFPAGIIANWLATSYKTPNIITEHWSRIEGFMNKPVLSSWGKKAYTNATIILPVSSFLKNRISALLPNIKPAKFEIIGNVIDSNIFFYTEKIIDSKTITFCAISTWTNKKIPDKLPELFIKALSSLQKETALTLKLIMIGGGDKIDELKTLCKHSDLTVEFTGFIEKNEIAKCLQNSDFLIHASTIETFGVVIVEALMCGTPVICSNVGALPEIINNTNGKLCDNNISSWISGLKELLTMEFDKKSISEDAKQKFDLKIVGSKINLIYKSLIEKDVNLKN